MQTAGNLTLNWQASSAGSQYSYCFSIYLNDGNCNAFNSAGTNTSVSVTAQPGRTYMWQVLATKSGFGKFADGNTTWAFSTPGPLNDWFSTATVVPYLPYRSSIDTTLATTTSEDPIPDCGFGSTARSVWYFYTPSISGPVTVNTFGSNYDTVLSIYTGVPGSFSPVACNDDTYGLRSTLTFQATAGQRLAILVTASASDGGNLVLNVSRPTERLETDLNGDGRGDVFTYDPNTGAWVRLLSDAGGGFSVQSQGVWAPGWTVTPARFTTDTATDFFLFNSTTGEWTAVENNGTTFQMTMADQWWPGWERYVIDLNGDGISDLFLYDPATGTWFKCVTSPSGFTYFQGGWNPGWEIYPMTLNSDELGDLFLINRATGRWFWVLGQVGAGFFYPATDVWFSGWNLHPGDFNADGFSDLLLHDPATGTWFVAANTANTGSGFTYSQGGWSLGWKPYAADLTADGRDDLFLHDPATGVWFEMAATAAFAPTFTNVGGQIWSLGWRLYPAEMTGDRRVDMLLYDPLTGVWYQARNTSNGIFAYTSGTWATGLTIVTRAPVR
jgi:hypothetical protein